jgi:hypothetical protein
LKIGEEEGMGWVLLLLLLATANGCLQLWAMWVLLLLFVATPTDDKQRSLLLCCAFVD